MQSRSALTNVVSAVIRKEEKSTVDMKYEGNKTQRYSWFIIKLKKGIDKYERKYYYRGAGRYEGLWTCHVALSMDLVCPIVARNRYYLGPIPLN